MTKPHDQENNRQPYPTPQYPTLEGMEEFHRYVESKARTLAAELDYRHIGL